MRLTLRTLLAWLDDTLPPAEVRQIGQQVNDSPFAKELVEKIQLVTRQRRHTVPSSSGPDATDPSLVARYLDNALTPEETAEFEKKCLTSDVHLAEVASVHQILSLLGQKAKVPVEARQRMYHLIKGREAVSSQTPRAFSTGSGEPAAAEVPGWEPIDLPARSAWERYGPLAGVAAVVALLVWSTSSILRQGPADDAESQVVVVTTKPEPPRPAPALPVPVDPAKTVAATPADPAPDPEKAETKAEVAETDAAKEAEAKPAELAEDTAKPAVPLPAGALGFSGKPDGPLLRQKPQAGATRWERLKEQAPLAAGERIVNLAPFHNTLVLGDTTVELVRESEVRLRQPEAEGAVGFDLERGRVVIHGGTPPRPVEVGLDNVVLTVTPPAGGVVGLERLQRRGRGEPETSAPSLRIYAPEGDVRLASGAGTATLTGPGSILFQPPRKFPPKSEEAPPTWVSDPRPSAVDRQLGEQFASFFKDNLSLLTSLVTAQEDTAKEVRALAISALGSIGQLPMIVAAFSHRDDPVTRHAAIDVLHDQIARGPEAVRTLRTVLEEAGGRDWAERVETLLVGFSPADARKEETYRRLIADLKDPDPGIRELAIENLRVLTGRDSLGYDPGTPEGPGVRAWQDLLQRKELPPRNPPASK